MKSNYIMRAKKFVPVVDEIIYNCPNIELEINRYNVAHKRKVIFAHGLTRYAFITSDYVIKVDYDDSEIARFGGCEDELELYGQAKSDNMEYLFAEITKYEYNGHDYYIMPRIYGIGRTEENAEEYMTQEEMDWCDDHELTDLHYLNYGWRNKHICIIDYSARY